MKQLNLNAIASKLKKLVSDLKNKWVIVDKSYIESTAKKINRMEQALHDKRQRTKLARKQQEEKAAKARFQSAFKFPKDDKTKTKKLVTDSCNSITSDSCGVPPSGNIYATIPPKVISWFASNNFIGYSFAEFIYQHPLVSKACSITPLDATRNGYNLSLGNTNENTVILDNMRDFDNDLKVIDRLKEIGTMRNCHGLAYVLFCVDQPDEDYLKPFNLDGLGKNKYMGFKRLDPNNVNPNVDYEDQFNLNDPNSSEPDTYRYGDKEIHKSWIIKLNRGDVPDGLKPAYNHGGIPLPQEIWEHAYQAAGSSSELFELLKTLRQFVYYTDLEAAVLDEEGLNEDVNQFIQDNIDNFSIRYAGSDDKVESVQTSITGLDDISMSFHQMVAAIAKVPFSYFMAQTPKGFNSTGEAEQRNYSYECKSLQTAFDPILNRHYKMLAKSMGNDTAIIKHEWNPIFLPTAAELADINNKNMATACMPVDKMMVSPAEGREVISKDPSSPYNGLKIYETDEQQKEKDELDEFINDDDSNNNNDDL